VTVRAVVFDLDGTLANTVDLPLSSAGQRRVPFDVLNLCPAGEPPTAVTISDQHRHLPGELIARGYRTAIITRSPGAYASTLIWLLQLDAERVMASGAAPNAADKLQLLATGWGIPTDEFIYVGDTDDDRRQAGSAGTQFCPAGPDIDMPATLLELLPRLVDRSAPAATVGQIIPGGPFDMRCGECKVALTPIHGETPRVCWNPACRVELDEPQQTTSTMGDVIDTVQSGAPLAPGQIDTLETSANHDLATAAGVVALRQYPAQHRARLQALILRYLSAEARECVTTLDLTESRFGFDPRLVTLNEINGESGTESAAAAARVFPPLRVNELPVPNHPERTFELRAMWPYWHVEYGQHLWQAIKDWGHGMRSGSEVHQSLLSFVALVLAGNALSETDQPGFAIVPAPSNTMSARQPGQCSLRLGQRVAEILECEFINALEKRRGGRIAVRRDPQHDLTGRTVILVDDQVTDGNTMNGCVKALVEAGAEVVRVLTWSSSHETTEPTTSSCWLRRHHLPCDEHDGQTLF
jgi:hypothetical protein